MRSIIEKLIVGIIAIAIGILSSRLQECNDFLWSIRVAVIPVMMTLLTLYITLSMNLLKALDDLPMQFHEKAMMIISSMKSEIFLEIILILVTFVLLILHPFLNEYPSMIIINRCMIDGLIIVDVTLFIISIIDTYFGYLDLIKTKQ